jgi:hypothetical protein
MVLKIQTHPLSWDVEVTLQNFGENALVEPGNRWNDSEAEVASVY